MPTKACILSLKTFPVLAAILRDCKPGDLDYHPRELAKHVLGLGWNQKTLSEAEEMSSPVEFRKDIIEGTFISGRETWFRNFRDGITCKSKYGTLLYTPTMICLSFVALLTHFPSAITGEECVPISDCFSSMALENVERLVFATHEFSADDLFRYVRESAFPAIQIVVSFHLFHALAVLWFLIIVTTRHFVRPKKSFSMSD